MLLSGSVMWGRRRSTARLRFGEIQDGVFGTPRLYEPQASSVRGRNWGRDRMSRTRSRSDVLSFYPLLRPDDNSAKNLKGQAHLIPGNSSMNRGRNPFIYEAETGIVMDECIFAGKHKSQAPLFPGICNSLL